MKKHNPPKHLNRGGDAPISRKSTAPNGLSAESRTFWNDIVREYDITDSAGLKLIGRVCESLDRLRDAQRRIKRDGSVIGDKKGSLKSHPAVAIEKEAHRQMLESLKMLNLDLEPLKAIGRPSGS